MLRAAPAFVRFVVAGLVNTGVTFVLFLVLAQAMPDALAYTISYVVGIALAYFLNALIVFQAGMSVRTAFRFPLVYGVQYLYGLCLLSVLVSRLHVPSAVAMATVIATSVPLTFFLSRLALRASG